MKFFTAILLLTSLVASARDIRPEIAKAERFGRGASSLVFHIDVRPFWSADGSHLAYRVDAGRDEQRFFQVDLITGRKDPAFDHELLAKALAKASGHEADAKRLQVDQLEVTADGTVRFRAFAKSWRWDLSSRQVSPDNLPPQESRLLYCRA